MRRTPGRRMSCRSRKWISSHGRDPRERWASIRRCRQNRQGLSERGFGITQGDSIHQFPAPRTPRPRQACSPTAGRQCASGWPRRNPRRPISPSLIALHTPLPRPCKARRAIRRAGRDRRQPRGTLSGNRAAPRLPAFSTRCRLVGERRQCNRRCKPAAGWRASRSPGPLQEQCRQHTSDGSGDAPSLMPTA